VFFVYLVLEL